MSQEQPRRTQDESIKYGDVFNVSGDLAGQPISPQDAAMMQSAENLVIGQTQKGGPAAVMQSAAAVNERSGVVAHRDASDIPAKQGVAVTETDLPGRSVVTEYVGGQIIGQYVTPAPIGEGPTSGLTMNTGITIGEALEASAMTAGDKPVDRSDAAAIQAAEVRATGSNVIQPGGLASQAQSAADNNARIMRDDGKTKLGDILKDATAKLSADKEVTRADAEGVLGAEIRNKPDMTTHPGGVAASVLAAARLNQS